MVGSLLERPGIELNGTSMTYPARSNRPIIKPALYIMHLPEDTQKSNWSADDGTGKLMISRKPIKLYTHLFRIRSRSRDRRADVSPYRLLTLGTRIRTASFFLQKKIRALWISSKSQFILLEIPRIPKARSH